MSYKRVLTVQDISCVGQCSLTVALPILSAAGVETSILPSAVLSTHTAGFTGYTVRDLTEDMPGIIAHWKKENIRFDAIYTGYLGSTRQIALVKEMFSTLGKPGFASIVDPAMADGGKLYPAFDQGYVEEMKGLVAAADIILPNITEACFLTGLDYREDYNEDYIEELIARLRGIGAKTVVLTGVGYSAQTTGVVTAEGELTRYYSHRRIPKGSHGTGDVYASAFAGAFLRGKSVYDAAALAAEYTVRCIENTAGDPEHWYGVKFEPVLPYYIEQL
ncbi:MAG: pyridoxamine kinase [Oscillospiraceae bacterium]|nr:pyridoxamine kinase [Oscillospiraceae bacterium]